MKWSSRSVLRLGLAAAFAVSACAAAGCSIGGGDRPPGGDDGDTTTVTVTREFGGTRLGQVSFDRLPAGPTAMRLLQSEFDVETSYGGRFVTSIEGVYARSNPARDWIYYVNGRESEVGAAERRLRPGDRVQWDYHRWDAVRAGKAIVGAFPQPLSGGGARLVCVDEQAAGCAQARRRLRAAGVRLREDGKGVPVVVGIASELDFERYPDLRRPPRASGVFVQARGGQVEMTDEAGELRGRLLPGQGVVVAAMSELWPVWYVTGVDEAGVTAAARVLDERALADKFGVVAEGDGGVSDLPRGPGV